MIHISARRLSFTNGSRPEMRCRPHCLMDGLGILGTARALLHPHRRNASAHVCTRACACATTALRAHEIAHALKHHRRQSADAQACTRVAVHMTETHQRTGAPGMRNLPTTLRRGAS